VKTDAHWEKVGMRPHHGICLPLFSLKMEQDSGSGEFLDLIPVIAWCRKAGFDCLQLLPLNDTGGDPSPYNPISSCALDPVYLSLPHSGPPLPRRALKAKKLRLLRDEFPRAFPALSREPAYTSFLEKSPWLSEYCRYMAMKEPGAGEDFYRYVQYLAFSQLSEVKKAAEAHGIQLVGDLPLCLSPDSADVVSNPGLFRKDLVAGAPPDKYNALGQKWGFPLYDWDAMRKDRFRWWKRRLSALSPFYHLYRIDHVVGFFRIWAIEEGKKPSEGHFIPSDPAVWANHGQALLEMMIESSPLLPIAEDLGTIPPEVYPILKALGIPGTKILRWEMDTPLDSYEPLSLTTVSTADMEPLPLWWREYPEEAAAFAASRGWEYEPSLSGERQIDILSDAHHTSSLFHINLLQEYLFPFPELSRQSIEEERINIPGTLLPGNWAYRFRPSFEEIAAHEKLLAAIRKIIS